MRDLKLENRQITSELKANARRLTCRLISQGRTPFSAKATIRSRVSVGNGRPLINSPPSWFIDDEQKRFLSKDVAEVRREEKGMGDLRRFIPLTL